MRKHEKKIDSLFCFRRFRFLLLESYPTNYRSGMQFPDYARERESSAMPPEISAHTLCHYCLLLLATRPPVESRVCVETIRSSSKKVLRLRNVQEVKSCTAKLPLL
jgi:hypothetical protein